MSFQISDKVVCVDDFISPRCVHTQPNGPVKKGEVYVVTGTLACENGTISLFILGKPSISSQWGVVGWKAERFRRLQDLKNEAKSTHKIAAK